VHQRKFCRLCYGRFRWVLYLLRNSARPQDEAMTTRSDTPLYQQLASHYGDAIAKGALRSGGRMPSVRELMRRHSVSLSTALQTLRSLEDGGWLEARPRVGYFVREARRLEELLEPDLRAPLASEQIRFAGRYVGLNERISLVLDSARRAGVKVDLGGATPGPELFDAAAMNRSAAALLREPR
jgi:DNA-binding transcriptional regulator YhcF (GntR family)